MPDEIEVLDSILLSVKKNIGITRDAKEFDADIIMAINSVFGILAQLGVGNGSFFITGENDKWTDFLDSNKDLEMIKNYISLKVGLMFDTPQSSAVIEVKKAMIAELEWRINVFVDPGKKE